MHTLPESEARALLAQPHICPDAMDWTPLREQRGCSLLECGVVDATGIGGQLFVQLQFQRSAATGLCKYKFSVFRLSPGGPERIYQLDIRQHPKPPKDLHAWSHEHFGTARVPGGTEWQRWGYSDVLQHFCQQTNIEFRPAPPHPEHFELKA